MSEPAEAQAELHAEASTEVLTAAPAEALAEAPAEAQIALKRQMTLSLRSKIRSLRTIALWTFRRISKSVHLPLSTVFSICAWPGTPY